MWCGVRVPSLVSRPPCFPCGLRVVAFVGGPRWFVFSLVCEVLLWLLSFLGLLSVCCCLFGFFSLLLGGAGVTVPCGLFGLVVRLSSLVGVVLLLTLTFRWLASFSLRVGVGFVVGLNFLGVLLR